jgi:hypothetical protein
MKPITIDRRDFVCSTAKAGVAVCGLCMCSPIASFAAGGADDGKKITTKDRCFCGYRCPEDCAFLQGTLTDNLELKKKAWTLWKIEERFGVAFDPEQAICYGCKTMDKPKGIVLSRCTVRDCAIEKGHECCIECDELTGCEKNLWNRFPEFKNQVIELQGKYRKQA